MDKNHEEQSRFRGRKKFSKDLGTKKKFEPKHKNSRDGSKPRMKKTSPLVIERYPSVIGNEQID